MDSENKLGLDRGQRDKVVGELQRRLKKKAYSMLRASFPQNHLSLVLNLTPNTLRNYERELERL